MDRKRLIFTLVALGILLIFFVRNLLDKNWFLMADVAIALLGIGLFLYFFDRARQDLWSYGVFLFALLLHNAFLYGTVPLGLRFDHYMHFIGGFAIVLIADRAFFEVKRGFKHALLIVIFALGVGAVGEIIEWLGYGLLGAGDGFLFFGLGDEGEWRNATLDMIFNLFGGLTAALISWRKKK